MKTIRKMMPVLLMASFIVLVSLVLYNRIVKQETERCWQELSTTAQNVNQEITTKFADELVKLHLIGELMTADSLFEVDQIEQLHIEMIQPKTIFTRIDVLYPDNTIVSNGKEYVLEDERVLEFFSFDEVAAKGEHMTSRMKDFITGKDCIYYVLPVPIDGETQAILIGYIEADGLSDIFQPLIYNGLANICIIDSEDGNFIMDSWHDELGNAFAMEQRELVEEYKDVDLKQDIRNHKTGAIAFESQTTGDILYMYYMPMEGFDWQLAIFAPEAVLFENLFALRKLFVVARILEIAVLCLYFGWNISTVNQLETSNQEIEKQRQKLQQISYLDMLTRMYNRNKYMDDWALLRKQTVEKIGIAFIDLNGLKQINDTMSHEAGDRYLKSAAEEIRRMFSEHSYRIGGDEFVILVHGIEHDIFAQKIKTLQENLENVQVSVSTGWIWKEACVDLDEMLNEAEKRMYEEKRKYYLVHDRRR